MDCKQLNARGELNFAIRTEIERGGPISLARFMSLALYDPEHGYYARGGRVGRGGDFYTSVSVGPLFGEMLAHCFAAWMQLLPDGKVQIVESGANDGRLALDLLTALSTLAPSLAERIEYGILEPFEQLRRLQEATLDSLPHPVRWFASWDEFDPQGVRGVIFSNELLDAMPVHQLRWDAREGKWHEWGVGFRSGRFDWERLGPSDLARLAGESATDSRVLQVLPDGYTIEVSSDAHRWWSDAAGRLENGWLATFDYGSDGFEVMRPERPGGTLRAYRGHQIATDVLADPGEQDITTHVNFSEIRRAGEEQGLQTIEFTRQGAFLTGLLRQIEAGSSPPTWDAGRSRQFQTLTHPEHLGHVFRVLVQSRGIGQVRAGPP
jgi:SAM-dependent MidA family methyltransferase